MQTIKLGKITAPQGIRGECRVLAYTDEVTRFSEIERLWIGNKEYRIEAVSYRPNMLVIKLEGVDDRNAAEALRNQELLLDRSLLWEQPEDTYFIDDLAGCRVVLEDGSELGTLRRVHSRPAQDLYEIETKDGGSFLLPAVKEFVRGVDLQNRTITIRVIEGML